MAVLPHILNVLLVVCFRQHILLMEYNTKLMDAFKMYNSLMSELPNYGYVMATSKVSGPPPQQQPQMVRLLQLVSLAMLRLFIKHCINIRLL